MPQKPTSGTSTKQTGKQAQFRTILTQFQEITSVTTQFQEITSVTITDKYVIIQINVVKANKSNLATYDNNVEENKAYLEDDKYEEAKLEEVAYDDKGLSPVRSPDVYHEEGRRHSMTQDLKTRRIVSQQVCNLILDKSSSESIVSKSRLTSCNYQLSHIRQHIVLGVSKMLVKQE